MVGSFRFCSILSGVIGTLTLDKFGRKPLLLVCNFILLALNVLFLIFFRISETYKVHFPIGIKSGSKITICIRQNRR